VWVWGSGRVRGEGVGCRVSGVGFGCRVREIRREGGCLCVSERASERERDSERASERDREGEGVKE